MDTVRQSHTSLLSISNPEHAKVQNHFPKISVLVTAPRTRHAITTFRKVLTPDSQACFLLQATGSFAEM